MRQSTRHRVEEIDRAAVQCQVRDADRRGRDAKGMERLGEIKIWIHTQMYTEMDSNRVEVENNKKKIEEKERR